jgi:hypothetical protein
MLGESWVRVSVDVCAARPACDDFPAAEGEGIGPESKTGPDRRNDPPENVGRNIMARNHLKTVLSLAAALLFFSALAMAEKAQTIDVYTDAVLPDGQELKAGKYKVVVGDAEKEVQFLQGKNVVAKHSCQAVERNERNRYNEVRYTETSDKKEKLTEIRLAGKSYVLNLDVQQGM